MKSILISFLYLYLHFYDLKAEKLNNYNCREIGDMTNNINNKPFYSMKIFSCMIPYNEEALIKIDSNNAIATIPNVTLPNATQQLLSNVTIPNAPSPVPNAPSSVPNAPSSVPNAIEPSISPSSITLIEEIQETCKIPLIYSGGINSINDVKNIIQYKIDAVAIGSALHYNVNQLLEKNSTSHFFNKPKNLSSFDLKDVRSLIN